MKGLFFLAASMLIGLTSFSQTLKITGLEASVQKLYDNHAPRTLGKSMVIAIYDNSASVKVGVEQLVYLQKVSDSVYSNTTYNTDQTESYTYSLTVTKTAFVMTSATFTWRVRQIKSPYQTANYTITGKRF
ncbi:hypothetical protein IDJ77_11525 [Mucilaginibacter sp. ZT4R22]|uniref:Uncharacterized protein n=1 Tax=Mucilaginibacter pankratovii TaxID=2772110 RepID=A0ABR7WQ41_9SPHI|nr:hypothetical protein [Mucilaginibacter pankratovii]MBD1364439.1 hypothetical protein [Mucilaginibacter pankratovii]